MSCTLTTLVKCPVVDTRAAIFVEQTGREVRMTSIMNDAGLQTPFARAFAQEALRYRH